jgi:lysophospholipase L1-like esterase
MSLLDLTRNYLDADSGADSIEQVKKFSVDEFLNLINAKNVSANQATESGLKLLYNEGYTPSEAVKLWNDAFGTKFTADDYATSLNNYGIKKSSKPQLAVFGDSISSSVGYALDDKGGGYSDTTYGNNLAQYLGQSLKVNAVNNSMGGTTSSDSLTGTGIPYAGSVLPIEYGDFASYITSNKPETALLRFGAADAIRLNDPATTLRNIESMIKLSQENGTKPILVGVTPFAKMGDFNAGNIDAGITDSMIASADAINQGIKDLASKYNAQFIDVRQVPVPKGALLDGVHPSAEYGASLNDYIASQISSVGTFKQPETKAAEPTAMTTAPAAITPTASSTIKDYQGKTYDTTTLLNLAKGLAPSIDANRLMGGVYSTKGASIGFNYDEATKALGYEPSAAEQVVLDMARHLMNEGVTSVDQIEATETNRRFGSTYSGDGGTIYEIKRDANGNLVTSTWGKTTSDKGNIIAAASIAGAFMGIPADIGTAVLGQGASNLAVNTIGGAIFGGGTAALGGGDVLKGALLGGAGGALGSYLNTAGGATLGEASDIAMQMADAGKTLPEIEAALTNSGYSPTVVAESLKDAVNVLASSTSAATTVPSTVPSLLDTVSVVGSSTAPTLTNLLGAASVIPTTTPTQVTAPVTTPTTTPVTEQTITSDRPTSVQDVINTVASVIPTTTPTQVTTTTPAVTEQVVTADRPATVADIINSITSVAPVTTPTTTTPVTTPSVIPEQVITGQSPNTNVADVINTIAATIPTTTPTVTPTSTVVPEQVITAKAPTTITQDVINAITSILPTTTPVTTKPVTTPVVQEQVITADRPTTISDVINTIVSAVTPTTTPTTTPKTTTETTKEKDKSLGVSDVIRLAQIGTTVAALNAASNAGGGTNQYDIVPVPESWTTPTTTGGTPTTLPPINFGNRNLLVGTQWEKLLNPNYGKIPEPVQYGQPSDLSYNDLMGILGNRQGMPSASNLTINDIISGIQNQYGQVPSRTMG